MDLEMRAEAGKVFVDMTPPQACSLTPRPDEATERVNRLVEAASVVEDAARPR